MEVPMTLSPGSPIFALSRTGGGLPPGLLAPNRNLTRARGSPSFLRMQRALAGFRPFFVPS